MTLTEIIVYCAKGEENMRLFILLITLALFACSDDATAPVVQNGTLTGVWEGTDFFTIRYDDGIFYMAREPGHGLTMRSGHAKVKGGKVEIAIMNPFYVSISDVLYFEGRHEGNEIPGVTWTNYSPKTKTPFTFRRVR